MTKRRNALIAMGVLIAIGAFVVFRFAASGTAGPRDAAVALLDAWQRGDSARIAQLTHGSRRVVREAYEHQAQDLGTWPTRVALRSLGRSGDRATARYRATFRLSPEATWRYDGAVRFAHGDAGWQAVWSPANVHPDLSGTTRFRVDRAWPTRAAILAADGTALTIAAPVVTVGIEPRRMSSREDTVAALQRYLDVDPARASAALDAPGVQPDYFVPIVTVPEDVYQSVKPQIYPVPGLLFRRGVQRQAATPQLAAHVVGSTGPVTKELLDRLGAPYRASDTVGRSGLERAYERRLAGTPALVVSLVDDAGVVVDEVERFPGRDPQPVRTTIDLAQQQRAEAAVGTTSPAALVAIRPSDGAVQAVVSTPLTQEFDRALDGAYPPGSTFKVITSAALLGNGVAPDTTTSCPATLTVNGREFRNFEGEADPSLTFRRAFAQSCNNAFIGLAGDLPPDALATAAAQFGFGQSLDLGLASRGGSFPEPGDDTERAAAAIGQGRVTASPLAMAGVAGTVANGEWRRPVLVTDPEQTPGRLVAPVDPGVIANLRTLMRDVVSSGTGTSAAVAGQDVAGKTGTAEFGNDKPPKTHAWFIGFRGDLAFAVLVEGGGVGGRVAAPIAHTFLAG